MTPDLFPMVLAGHLLGDFVVQTDWQAANKETSWSACIQHALTYNLILALFVLPFWHTPQAYLFIGISLFTHALIDRRWPTKFVLRLTRSPGFSTLLWGVISTDQAIHISILAMAYYMLGR